MTTQDDKPDSADDSARTELRPSAAEWKLKSMDPEAEKDEFPVRGEMLIGRVGCDILLASAHASRKHAKVFLVRDTLWVEDLGSANGTFVNDERIDSAELKSGDRVRFDTHEFIVAGPEAKTAAAPAGSGEQKPVPAKRPGPKAKKKARTKKAKTTDAGTSADPSTEQEGSSPRKAGGTAAAPPDPEPESEPERGQGSQPESDSDKSEPDKSPGPESEPEAGPQRGAWYERETPNLTRKVDAGELQDRLVDGGTQIVRGIQGLTTPGLVGTSGDLAGVVVPLDKDSLTIGRSGTDIILDEPSVSTKHAQIVRDGERWKLVDLMSANHIYVNGKKTQVAYLSPGDAVRFGRLEMRFVIDSTQVPSRARPEMDEVIRGSGSSAGKNVSWLYIAIGFVVVVALGGYMLFAR
jgi:pSer/pThr/pTyr-binding forkhead associated (FHA) protein